MTRPSWIKVGSTEIDLFEILDALKHGKSIDDIAKDDIFITVSEIRELLMRASLYLHNHLILDSYLETIQRIKPIQKNSVRFEWSANEIHELVNLHLSGATVENIAQLMRKDIIRVQEKLEYLNLINKGTDNG